MYIYIYIYSFALVRTKKHRKRLKKTQTERLTINCFSSFKAISVASLAYHSFNYPQRRFYAIFFIIFFKFAKRKFKYEYDHEVAEEHSTCCRS